MTKADVKSQTLFHFCSSDSKAVAHLERYYKSIRCLQLFIKFFNILHCDMIFTWKLDSICISIISGYAAIAHFKENPIFGIMYYVILFDASLTYSLIYEKGFKVPHTLEKVKNLLQLSTSKTGNRTQRQIIGRQLMSIPPVGIKVGDFHMLETTSATAYLNYVLTHIVNMLVAFRQ